MSQAEDFLRPEEEAEIVTAIIAAERETSGEIRVHIEGHSDAPPMDRAREVFRKLKMEHTKEANGVLLYVAVTDKKFAIYGDKGIDEKVPPGFWDSTKNIIQTHFRNGRFKQGIIAGIREAGQQLRTHFPWQSGDVNELDNEVSKG